MSAAIQTKFIGPTDKRGPRVKAVAPPMDGKPRTMTCEWQHNLGEQGNHRYAAEKLASKLKWEGQWVEGHTDTGYVFVRLTWGEAVKEPVFSVAA